MILLFSEEAELMGAVRQDIIAEDN